jgi:hypothetical protein
MQVGSVPSCGTERLGLRTGHPIVHQATGGQGHGIGLE